MDPEKNEMPAAYGAFIIGFPQTMRPMRQKGHAGMAG